MKSYSNYSNKLLKLKGVDFVMHYISHYQLDKTQSKMSGLHNTEN